MAYNKAQVTDAGNALFAQILANKSSLSIDKIEISNVQLAASTVITSMTKIDNVVQTTSANGLQKSGNSFIISTAVSNANVTTDYQAWVFGIWGSDSANGTSTLIEVITTTGTPDTIPAYSGSTPVTYNYKFATALSNASSISLSMLNDAYATNDTVLHTSGNETSTGTKTFDKIEVSNGNTPDVVLTDGASISLDNGESKFTPANNSTVVHTTGDETVDGKKAFKVDPVDGAGNAYAKTVDVNQQLDIKVTDNHDGTEQLNGVQIQPYNKLTDTIGGRNYLLNSDQPITVSDGGTNYRYAVIPSILSSLSSGTYIFTAEVSGLVGGQTSLAIGLSLPNNSMDRISVTNVPIVKGKVTKKITITNDGNLHTGIIVYSGFDSGSSAYVGSAGCTAVYNHYQFIKSDVIEDWRPAPEDKVNVSDMRKPASDVAGIEEVSALQTQVNNSAVGTNLYTDTKNFDNLASWSFSWWKKTTDTYKGLSVVQTTADWAGVSQYVQVKKGDILTYSVYAKNTSGTGTSTIYWELDSLTEGSYSSAITNPVNNAVTITDSWQKVSGTAVATSDGYLRPRLERSTGNTNTLQIAGIKLEKGSVATDWCPNSEDKADDSKVVHTADMRKPASDVAGIEEVNAKQDKLTITPADDSKVAHLSGANNFDTVPTVNNNPLLLASSLPSDLARTGQANTFSKQQIFSTNPTNGTQVYPIYATADTEGTATTLIASLQSSGYSGIVGVPES